VIRESATSAAKDPVHALAVSSQGEAFTPVGPGGEILGNAFISSDTRAAAIAEAWSAGFGREKLYHVTGHTAHPMFTLFKLLWLRDNRPDIWNIASRFLCFEDLLHHRLGLEPAISWPLAGRTMMFNVRTHEWDGGILSAVGLEPAKLARPLRSGEAVGTIPTAVARELALSDRVLVVAGGHDQTCAALGAGVTTAGKAAYATGTTECICPAFLELRLSDELFHSNLCTYDFTVGRMFTTVAFSLTGGNLLRWFRDQWAAKEIEEANAAGVDPYDIILGKMSTEPTRLLVLPYFTPSGTPYFDTQTPGAIVGLRLDTERGDVLRALLEGVAFEMRLNVEILDRSGIRIDEFIASGGGAKSRSLTQLKADVLGRPITTLDVTETGCYGAALLAQAAHKGVDVREVARHQVRKSDAVEPDPVRAKYYQERFAAYKELYPALRRFQSHTGSAKRSPS
jgi:xylulokinase